MHLHSPQGQTVAWDHELRTSLRVRRTIRQWRQARLCLSPPIITGRYSTANMQRSPEQLQVGTPGIVHRNQFAEGRYGLFT